MILLTFDRSTGTTHVVTYGKTIEDCDQAAQGGNLLKKTLGWPENLCNAQPSRIRKLLEENERLKAELESLKK